MKLHNNIIDLHTNLNLNDLSLSSSSNLNNNRQQRHDIKMILEKEIRDASLVNCINPNHPNHQSELVFAEKKVIGDRSSFNSDDNNNDKDVKNMKYDNDFGGENKNYDSDNGINNRNYDKRIDDTTKLCTHNAFLQQGEDAGIGSSGSKSSRQIEIEISEGNYALIIYIIITILIIANMGIYLSIYLYVYKIY